MDETVQKSCWGVATKAAFGLAGIILLAWLFVGGDAVALIATS